MGFLFSKPAAPAAATLSKSQEAELDMKRARMRMRKTAARVEKESANLKSNALILAKAGKREQAVRLLQVRQLKERRLKALWVQLDRLDRMGASIESTRDQMEFADSLKAGTAALKDLQEQMPIERMEDLLADNDEAIAYQDEVDDLLTRELPGSDMAMIDAELATMVPAAVPVPAPAPAPAEAAAGAAESEFPQAPTHVPMPEAPTHVPAASAAQSAVLS
jgi:charged multivesicular body protein 6